jgi:hypothetical protein
VSWSKCSIDGKQMGPKQHPQENKLESHSPKKSQTTGPEVESLTIPLVDKDGHAAFKVNRKLHFLTLTRNDTTKDI